MAKPKKKLTAAQRAAAKKQRKKNFIIVFMNGRQVRVRRPPTIDDMDQEEFIRRNADPIWLHQNRDYEILHEKSVEQEKEDSRLPFPKSVPTVSVGCGGTAPG